VGTVVLVAPRLRRLLLLALLAGGLIFAAAASASAATRFAAPGGAGAEPCYPAQPCSLFTAADREGGATAGDEVVLAPGEYSEMAGDFGMNGFVTLEEGISVHGAADQPRPLIKRTTASGLPALTVTAGDTVSHVEVDNTAAFTGIEILGGVVEDVIARSSVEGSIACRFSGGTIRNTVCLSTGARAAAIGEPHALIGSPKALALRNVTAVSTGLESFGLQYSVFGVGPDSIFTIDASGVIVRGRAKDLLVEARSATLTPGTGAKVAVNFDHSSYATIATVIDEGGGTATVTPADPGTAPALLAADGFHQLAGSPTVDRGPEGLPGEQDIDGDPRTIGGAPDIGADELVIAPSEPPPTEPPPTVPPTNPASPPGGVPVSSRPSPMTRIKRHPPKRSANRAARFSFVSGQAGATFECRLDRRPFKRCSSPHRIAVKPGRHTFRVRAVTLGIADPTPAVFRWTVSRPHRRS
jgi:hypothetical protein